MRTNSFEFGVIVLCGRDEKIRKECDLKKIVAEEYKNMKKINDEVEEKEEKNPAPLTNRRRAEF